MEDSSWTYLPADAVLGVALWLDLTFTGNITSEGHGHSATCSRLQRDCHHLAVFVDARMRTHGGQRTSEATTYVT